MEQIIVKHLEEHSVNGDLEDYLFPKGMVRNKRGRVGMGPLLSGWFWLSLAAKNHKEPEDGEFDTAGWLDSRRAKMNHENEFKDDTQYEGGHYSSVEEDKLIVDEARFELQGRLVELHAEVWPIIKRLNAVTKFGDEFWDDTFNELVKYPVNDPKRAERGIMAAIQRLADLEGMEFNEDAFLAEMETAEEEKVRLKKEKKDKKHAKAAKKEMARMAQDEYDAKHTEV
jgi:hypothetical protein